MLKNYIKITLRTIRKNKIYASINILGLSIGIACCVFIFLYIHSELSFDDFHKNKDRIYRVVRIFDPGYVGITSPPVAENLANDYPAMIDKTSRYLQNASLVTYKDHSFLEEKFAYTDENFLEVFSFPLVEGNAETALKGKDGIIISQAMARKYFGAEDPMGKTLELDKTFSLKVTGVLRLIPENSHIKFDFIAPIRLFENQPFMKNWWSNSLYSYVLLEDKVNPEDLEASFPTFIDTHMGEEALSRGAKVRLHLQPLKEIHFQENMAFDSAVIHGNFQVVVVLGIIALFILVIACINFMNLSTAQSAKRSTEIGVRKTMGAEKKNLALQFIFEAISISALAMLLAVLFVIVGLPAFNNLVEKQLQWPFSPLVTSGLALGLTLLVGLLAGSYPASVLSSFQPAKSLKGKQTSMGHGVWLRKSLVVLQFFISIVLIIATITINRQMHYLQTKNLGFDKSHIMMVPLNNDQINQNLHSFKNILRNDPQIIHVSGMSGEPGGFHDSYPFKIEDHKENTVDLRTVFCDYDYISIFNLNIIAGRDFSRDFPSDSLNTVIINETAAKQLGWTPEEALNKTFFNTFRDTIPRNVIGVVKDYNFTTLHTSIEPLILTISNDQRVAAIKLVAGNTSDQVSLVEDAWNTNSDQYPFSFNFLDQEFDHQYKSEQKQKSLINVFSILAIFIACLGLYGLVTFTAEQRTKEIGIRKVLGASVLGLVNMLSLTFTKLVVISLVLAIPVSYYAMNLWLDRFAYRINIGVGVFALAGSIALVIAWLTVSYQSIKVAMNDPVEALRSE